MRLRAGLPDRCFPSGSGSPVSHLQSWQRGYRWTAGSREQRVDPLTGVAGRVERALRNYLETFPFFVAATLLVIVTETHGWMTVLGAHCYFWGRIAYAILYAVNLPLARSLVWNIPTLGILMEVAAMFVNAAGCIRSSQLLSRSELSTAGSEVSESVG